MRPNIYAWQYAPNFDIDNQAKNSFGGKERPFWEKEGTLQCAPTILQSASARYSDRKPSRGPPANKWGQAEIHLQ